MLPGTSESEGNGKLQCVHRVPRGGRDRTRLVGLLSLIAVLIATLFLVFAKQPYSVVSDAGYQALSAVQFERHEVSAINSVRVVDPADLSHTRECPLLLWAPFAAYAFLAGLKAGLPIGTTARILAILASLAGATGWVWIASLIELKGIRKALGIGFAAIYCLRTHLMLSMGTADVFVYAIAPWLIGAAFVLSSKSRLRVTGRLIASTAVLSLACGAVYWVKYSGILMGLAIVGAVSLTQFRSKARPRLPILLSAFVLYSAAFALPPLILQAANHHRSGSDLLEVSAKRNRPRNLAMVRSFLAEETFHAGTVLFTPGPGINRLAQRGGPSIEWFLRAPGLLLLAMILWLSVRYLPPELRNLSVLLAAVPLMGIFVLSVVGRTRYTTAFERASLPSWILLELTLFALLGTLRDGKAVLNPNTRKVLAGLAGTQMLLFMWVPISAARQLWRIPAKPAYEITPNALYDPDLSRVSGRDAVNRIRRVIDGPADVIVPATYSDRAFGTDTWIELDDLGRLLPLNTMPFALEFTQGDGANFLGRTPFTTSRHVRVVVIAPNPYHRPDFHASLQQIKDRFVQAGQWVRSVPDGGDAFDIWIADIEGGECPRCTRRSMGTH